MNKQAYDVGVRIALRDVGFKTAGFFPKLEEEASAAIRKMLAKESPAAIAYRDAVSRTPPSAISYFEAFNPGTPEARASITSPAFRHQNMSTVPPRHFPGEPRDMFGGEF